MRSDPEVGVMSKLVTSGSEETTSDPGYGSDDNDIIVQVSAGAGDRVLPRVTGNRIILMFKRCGPGKLISSIPKILLNVSLLLLQFIPNRMRY